MVSESKYILCSYGRWLGLIASKGMCKLDKVVTISGSSWYSVWIRMKYLFCNGSSGKIGIVSPR